MGAGYNRLVFFAERGTWNETLQRYVRPDEVYFDASDDPIPSPFPDIPRSFWWCMVTLMTVRGKEPAGSGLPLSRPILPSVVPHSSLRCRHSQRETAGSRPSSTQDHRWLHLVRICVVRMVPQCWESRVPAHSQGTWEKVR